MFISIITRDELSNFFNVHKRIIDKKYFEENANDALIDLLRKFKLTSEVHYFFITNSKASESNKSEFKKLKDSCKHENGKNVEWHFKSFDELRDQYSRAESADKTIPEFVKIPIEMTFDEFTEKKQLAYLDLSRLITEEDNYKTILCTIKGSVLRDLYKHYKESLFSYNIRGFLGFNPVNKKMKSTIEDKPNRFFYFNNGISSICNDMEFKEDGKSKWLICKNFQIINGAQTTATIGNFPDVSKLDLVRVLLRITKTEEIKKETKGLNKEIITYNNSQTVIKLSDFRSNDEIQLFLEKQLRKYSYKGVKPFKNLVYSPKRKNQKKSNSEMHISMDMLARILYAFHYEPILIQKASKFLFDVDSENGGKYWFIFGNMGEETSLFENTRVKEIASVVFLWFKLEDILNRKKKQRVVEGTEDSINYQAYLAKWHFMWAYGTIIRSLYLKNMNNIINHLLSEKLSELQDNFVEAWFDEIAFILQDKLEDDYKIDIKKSGSKIEKVKGFNFRNWLRDSRAFESFATKLERRIEKNVFTI